MPYTSAAQRGWAHTPEGEKALGGPAKVAEWDHASKGLSLPAHAHAQGGPVMNKGYLGKTEHFAQGGPVLGERSKFVKDDDGDYEIKNSRHAKGGENFGNFLDGQDRFTSQNFAEQGTPANEQRLKPDEDWSKGHVKDIARRQGDSKSEKPVKPRG